ncbi:MAG: glycosyltransferase family 4 protein, partial [Thermoanaerobaculia bacterium]
MRTHPERALRVAALTGGRRVSASRFRVRQYIPRLRQLGVDVHEFIARFESYPPEEVYPRPLWAVATLAERLPAVARSHRFDLTLLQREMVSTFMTLEPLTKSPRVLDVDDALWLLRRGDFFRRLARRCTGVLCGNAYIADVVSRWNSRVRVLPTAVDTNRFRPPSNSGDPARPVIGWSGLPSGFPYLLSIERSLAAVLERNPDVRLRVVSRRYPPFERVPRERVEFIEWSEDVEVETIQGMTVGLMPLDETPWSLGKCSYKMLLYMACGVPAVVSPIGMNAEVLAKGPVGLGPRTGDEWTEALESLLRDPAGARRMGQAGRDVVLTSYGLDV